ncbi:hypothetical protein ACTFIW_001314 [Dictyostelium discoideum]
MSFRKNTFNNNPNYSNNNNNNNNHNHNDNGPTNGNVDAKLKKIVETITPRAEVFIKEFYYPKYDSSRADLIGLYKDHSVSIWNGTECKGPDHIGKLLAEIPNSVHVVETFDAQPVPSDDKENPNILITATGKVTYKTTSQHQFHQTFLLVKDPTNSNLFYLSYDCIRLIS